MADQAVADAATSSPESVPSGTSLEVSGMASREEGDECDLACDIAAGKLSKDVSVLLNCGARTLRPTREFELQGKQSPTESTVGNPAKGFQQVEWDQLNVSLPLRVLIQQARYEFPTPIQSVSLCSAMKWESKFGNNIVVIQADNACGKTELMVFLSIEFVACRTLPESLWIEIRKTTIDDRLRDSTRHTRSIRLNSTIDEPPNPDTAASPLVVIIVPTRILAKAIFNKIAFYLNGNRHSGGFMFGINRFITDQIEELESHPERQYRIAQSEHPAVEGYSGRGPIVGNYTVALVSGCLTDEQQSAVIAKPFEIMVGTPGQVASLLDQGRLSFENLHMFVLDEAGTYMTDGPSDANWRAQFHGGKFTVDDGSTRETKGIYPSLPEHCLQLLVSPTSIHEKAERHHYFDRFWLIEAEDQLAPFTRLAHHPVLVPSNVETKQMALAVVLQILREDKKKHVINTMIFLNSIKAVQAAVEDYIQPETHARMVATGGRNVDIFGYFGKANLVEKYKIGSSKGTPEQGVKYIQAIVESLANPETFTLLVLTDAGQRGVDFNVQTVIQRVPRDLTHTTIEEATNCLVSRGNRAGRSGEGGHHAILMREDDTWCAATVAELTRHSRGDQAVKSWLQTMIVKEQQNPFTSKVPESLSDKSRQPEINKWRVNSRADTSSESFGEGQARGRGTGRGGIRGQGRGRGGFRGRGRDTW